LIGLVKKGQNGACFLMIPDHSRKGDHCAGAWVLRLDWRYDGFGGKKDECFHSTSGYRGKNSHLVVRVQLLTRLEERAVFRDPTRRLEWE
jgi:hypothetical protein